MSLVCWLDFDLNITLDGLYNSTWPPNVGGVQNLTFDLNENVVEPDEEDVPFDVAYNDANNFEFSDPYVDDRRKQMFKKIVVELQTLDVYGSSSQIVKGKRNTPSIALDIWKLFWPFLYCKPIVQIDVTWMYGKYTQILLITVM